jgi:hypothetical protein
MYICICICICIFIHTHTHTQAEHADELERRLEVEQQQLVLARDEVTSLTLSRTHEVSFAPVIGFFCSYNRSLLLL